MAQSLKQRQVIIPLQKDATYLDAYSLTSGNLPSNKLHDRYLVETEDWRPLNVQNYYAAWAKEIVVYPEKNGKFKNGADVVDGAWKFDKNFMPQEAIGKEKVALFIKEPIISINGNKVTISAKNEDIVILQDFLQKDGWGKVDEETRMPIESKNVDKLDDKEKRYLWRIDGAGVRPLVRGYYSYNYRWRYVAALIRPDYAFGVGWQALENAVAPQVTSPLQLKPLIRDVNASLSKLSQTSKPEILAPIYKLVQALDIKE